MWIARDKDGELNLYTHKPNRCTAVGWDNESWDIESTDEFVNFMTMDPSMFPELTWEDEPIEVEFAIVKR